MRGMNSLSACDSPVYSDYVDDRKISVFSLDYQLTGHSFYITMYLCLGCDMSPFVIS